MANNRTKRFSVVPNISEKNKIAMYSLLDQSNLRSSKTKTHKNDTLQTVDDLVEGDSLSSS